MRVIKGGISSAKGFAANGIAAGIKRSGKLDLALIYSEVPAVSVGVYTKNSIIAAPLVVTKENLRDSKAQAIIINSGNANCFTGNFGLIDARKSTERIAKLLKIDENNVLAASTGIIGKPLPFNKIQVAAPTLVKGLNRRGGTSAARAILTTDLQAKEIAVRIKLGGKMITIGAMAKGSGMIAPNMATMLGFITTDAAIDAKLLKRALREAVAKSFNMITVDGCMSTNDMVVAMANGLAQNKPIKTGGKDFETFSKALDFICLDLSKKIIWDAEGITKFIEVHVLGAKSFDQARKVAFAIADSNLVKTAAFGSNPNWGRVAAAVGSLGYDITEKDLKIDFSPFSKKHIHIYADLNKGSRKATVYTSDLSLEYVNINGRYN